MWDIVDKVNVSDENEEETGMMKAEPLKEAKAVDKEINIEFVDASEFKKSKRTNLMKLIMLGDSAVGKSSIKARIENKEIPEEHVATYGVDFGDVCAKYDDTVFKLQIWDSAGESDYGSVAKIFFRGAHAAFLCYSIDNRKSFDSLKVAHEELKARCDTDIVVVLVGTKQDLESEREVTYEEALEFRNA